MFFYFAQPEMERQPLHSSDCLFGFCPDLKPRAQVLHACDVAFLFQDGGAAVGFMSLCSQVNVSLFQECFDLGPFHGLCKPHPGVLEMPQEPSIQEGTCFLKCRIHSRCIYF